MKKLSKHSDIFDDIDSLEIFRRTVEDDTRDRFDNYDMIYRFDNMRPLHDAGELKKKRQKEMINFGSNNRKAQEFIAPLEALVSGSNHPIRIKLDSNDFFVDTELSAFVTETYNELIYKDDEEMANLWRTIVGYGWQRGAIPVAYDYEDEGLFPRVADNLRFPVGTSLKIEKGINYFEFYEANMFTLEQMLNAAESKGDKTYIKTKGIRNLIKEIKEAYQGQGAGTGDVNSESDISDTSAADDEHIDYNRVTVHIVRYVEIRSKKNGDRYISTVEYVSGFDIDGKNTSSLGIIYAEEEAFAHAGDAIINCVFDEEVGGKKTTDNARGIGEAIFASGVAKERLKNKRLEGAMSTATPVILPNDNMDADEALAFRMGHHSVAPDGFTPDSFFFAPDNSRALDPIITELDGTNSSLAAGTQSNTKRGQESRNQTLDRLNVDRPIRGNRLSKATKTFVRINTMMVHRLFTLEPESDTIDYNIIKYFQYKVDEKIKEIYKLGEDEEAAKIRKQFGERKFGYNVAFTVESRRTIGDDPDRDNNAVAVVNQMLQQGVFDAQTASDVKRWVLLTVTNDDDLVNAAFRDPEPIRKDERLLAAFEWEPIKRSVFAGQEFEIDTRDIHIDHVERHLIDLIADVNKHGVRPWDQAEVMMFGAAVNHVGKHIRVVQQQPESRPTFQRIFPLFQQVVKQSALIIDELAAEQEQQEAQDPMEEATILLKVEQARLARTKTQEILTRLGIAIDDNDRLTTQTNLRNYREGRKLELMERDKYLKELEFNLDVRQQRQQQS